MSSSFEFEEKYPLDASLNNLSINNSNRNLDDLDKAIIDSLYNKAFNDIPELVITHNNLLLSITLYIETIPFKFWINNMMTHSMIDYKSLSGVGLKKHIDTSKTKPQHIQDIDMEYYGFAPYIELSNNSSLNQKTPIINCFDVVNFDYNDKFDGILGLNFLIKYGANINFGDKITLKINNLELICEIIDNK